MVIGACIVTTHPNVLVEPPVRSVFHARIELHQDKHLQDEVQYVKSRAIEARTGGPECYKGEHIIRLPSNTDTSLS